jgi:uncharacterized protein YjbI with pentapeptide repeats
MAKGKTKPAAAGTLAGKRVAFVGKFGYKDWDRPGFTTWARAAGAVVVDPQGGLDYLVVGEGRGGKPPGEVAKIQKRLPAVGLLDVAGLLQLVLPDPARVLKEIGQGRRVDADRFWDSFDEMCRRAGAKIDLRGADLRAAHLYGAKLEGITLDGADLRGAKAEYTHFGDLRGVNFDRAHAPNVYLLNLKVSTFRRAVLERAWMFFGNARRAAGCDFTRARMHAARARSGTFTDCTFAGADLSDADLEHATFERADFTKADLTRAHATRAKFKGANFTSAVLHRADLRDASLVNADLRDADLRDAVLGGADLTGATVAGADFAGAVLTGAVLGKVDFSKAKNFRPPVARTAGPKIRELVAAVSGSKRYETAAEVDLGKGEYAQLEITGGLNGRHAFVNARSRYFREGTDSFDWITGATFEQCLLNLADRWPSATLRLDAVTAKGSRTVRGPKLQELAAAAWAEAFGAATETPEQLRERQEAQHAAALRGRDELMKQIRVKGAAVWNDLLYRERDRLDLRGIDLSGADLSEIKLWSRDDLRESRFDRANLTGAEFANSVLHAASFAGANLTKAGFEASRCEKASFTGANLTKADLSRAKLQGADFTGATLTGAKLARAQFDEHTKFPAGFKPPVNMVWKGAGPRPGMRTARRTKAGTMDFDTFFKRLGNKVEVAKLDKAKSMLRAERFQLFADVKPDSVTGVVRSQSDPDLVYSCRLASDGSFACCTQNLRYCGGLTGAPCKHLLVLIVGLTKAGQLDPASVDGWIDASKSHQPTLDKDVMTDAFLRYNGAEAGEVDWRPTETIPEDFYAA